MISIKPRFIISLLLTASLLACGGSGSKNEAASATGQTDLSVISTGPHPAFPDGLASVIQWDFDDPTQSGFGDIADVGSISFTAGNPGPIVEKPIDDQGKIQKQMVIPRLWKLERSSVDLGCHFEDNLAAVTNIAGDELLAQPKEFENPTVICNDQEEPYEPEEGIKKESDRQFELLVQTYKAGQFSIVIPAKVNPHIKERLGVIWNADTVKYFEDGRVTIFEELTSPNMEEMAKLVEVFADEGNLAAEFTFKLDLFVDWNDTGINPVDSGSVEDDDHDNLADGSGFFH